MTKGIKHKDIGQELTQTEWEALDSHELESGNSFPEAPSEKDRYYRNDEHKWYIYNGTEWRPLGALDLSDADAAVGDVKDPKTFYAGATPKKTGTMPTVSLAPGSNAYPAGYHAGEGGGLPAVDADLVTGNIKNGITIFDVLGDVDVRDISDAGAVAGEVKTGSTFYAVGGARKTGSGTQTLNPANENVPAGYYVATTLSTVDGDLATANIKSGITIFGKVGSTNVRDSTDANASTSRVRSGYTFYAGGGARKTGTMPTRAIGAGSDSYQAGYHAGNVGGLDAIDVHLAPGNIKLGVNIFGKVGTLEEGDDVSDADALVGEVIQGATFYSVAAPRKTGTMPTVAIVAANDNYPAGYHVGNGGGLDAIDGDLAPGNIKSGVTIFGKLGTLTSEIAFDTQANDHTYTYNDGVVGSVPHEWITSPAGTTIIASTTLSGVDAGSIVTIAGYTRGKATFTVNGAKLHLYIGGVEVYVSGFISTSYIEQGGTGYRTGMSGSVSLQTKWVPYETVEFRILGAFVGGSAIKPA